jgi:zinc D-Ala-D-Ala dipeptidase
MLADRLRQEIRAMRLARIFAGIFAVIVFHCEEFARAGTVLPTGLVYLGDLDATILQDIRYAGSHNFVGRPVAGYGAAECVITKQAALALAKAQAEFATKKLSLVVWDCYRPARAVADFLRWSKNVSDVRMKSEFYPRSDKTKLFALGYLATRSAHSRGSTVDLGIMPVGVSSPPAYDPVSPLLPCIARKGDRFEDGTIDLGTGYDCLDVLASTSHPGVGKQAIDNRQLLRVLMERVGFKPYSKEWWHFELVDEPFPHQSFDFQILRRENQ